MTIMMLLRIMTTSIIMVMRMRGKRRMIMMVMFTIMMNIGGVDGSVAAVGDGEEDNTESLGLYLLSGTFIVAGVGLALGVLALALEHVIVKVNGLKVKSYDTSKEMERVERRTIDKQK
ncbi:hypothetical protein ElyMa_006590700 [Elysia marginata]|uniref:CNNM transmembrane domain-containing protein n=1 Tax=Elysia marginata TaxID=1093978 RepID=A0AAV4IGS0_9GAST|nr:hypothetical protein ElyMa_006590700 [Elysia marginata]